MLCRLALPLALLGLVPASAGAAGWLATSPVPLSNVESYGAKIAIEDSGRGIAAWTEVDNGIDHPMVAGYRHGSGWASAAPLSSANAASLDLAASPAGDEIVVWREGKFGAGTIHAATRKPGADTFENATGIVSSPGGSWPVVAALDDGTFAIAWVDGTNAKIALRNPGDASFTTTTITGLGAVNDVRLASRPGGGGALAITDELNGEGRLMLSISSGGAFFHTPTAAVSVDASQGDSLQNIGLGYGPGGTLGIGFSKVNTNVDAHLFSLIRGADGAIGLPSPVDQNSYGAVYGIQVAFAHDGTEAMSYVSRQSGPGVGRLAIAAPGGDWHPVTVPTAGFSNGAFQVAPVGSQLVALGGSYGGGLNGGPLPDVASLGTEPPGAPGNPVDYVEGLAAHGDDAVAVVTRQANGEDRVRAITWDGTPPVIAELGAPASATTGVATSFKATVSDALGTANVTWSFGDGDTATGDSATHAFATAGTFTVTVTATDGAGNRTTRSADVVVARPRPRPRRRCASSPRSSIAATRACCGRSTARHPSRPRSSTASARWPRRGAARRRRGTRGWRAHTTGRCVPGAIGSSCAPATHPATPLPGPSGSGFARRAAGPARSRRCPRAGGPPRRATSGPCRRGGA